MRGTAECNACPFWVDAAKQIDGIAGFCGWGPTPLQISPTRLEIVQPCHCKSLPEYSATIPAGSGLERARLWTSAARRINDLHQHQFRGLNLGQVCVVCAGSGVDPAKPKQAKVYGGAAPPDWKYSCLVCQGRGFFGIRRQVA